MNHSSPTTSAQAASTYKPGSHGNNIVPLYSIKKTVISKSNDGENTALDLIKPDGQSILAFVKGTPPLKQGQKLSNVDFTQKENSKIGPYYVINSYNIAA